MTLPDRWRDTTEPLATTLVGLPSVTNTAGEAAFAQALHGILSCDPYFAAHPDDLTVRAVPRDHSGRGSVFALVRGRTARTVVLAGHFDTVATHDYGELEPWALDTAALHERLITHLRAHGAGARDALALQDLEGGAFRAGRGMLDMKSGLAAGIAVLQWYAAQDDRPGSLLMIATPDEEDRSRGMRSAARALVELADQERLELAAAINLDASNDPGAGEYGQSVFLGSVGKLLLSFYVVGRPTHAGYPLDGANATFLAANLVDRLEWNGELAGDEPGTRAPAPVILYARDDKREYDITTPAAAWVCVNVLLQDLAAREVFARARRIADDAMHHALNTLHRRAAAWSGQATQLRSLPGSAPMVLTYRELYEGIAATGNASAVAELAKLERQVTSDAAQALPDACRILTERAWQLSGRVGPAVVLGVAAVPYPTVRIGERDIRERQILTIVDREVREASLVHRTQIGTRPFFAGVSDMSFLGRFDGTDLAGIAENTPAWDSGVDWDPTAPRPNLPVINIGPWGRDYHLRLERVHAPYSFEVLPDLVRRVAMAILEDGGGARRHAS